MIKIKKWVLSKSTIRGDKITERNRERRDEEFGRPYWGFQTMLNGMWNLGSNWEKLASFAAQRPLIYILSVYVYVFVCECVCMYIFVRVCVTESSQKLGS